MRYVLLSRNIGKVGDVKIAGGYSYAKQKSGGWQLVRDAKLKHLFVELYVTQGLTLQAISQSTGIPFSSIQSIVNHFGLMRKKKSMTDAKALEFCKKNHDLLVRMYVDLGMTLRDIAKAVRNKTSLPFKSVMLRRYFEASGVSIRTHAEAIAVATKHGRRHLMPRGQVLFARHAVDSWNYHIDKKLKGLTFRQYKIIVHRFTYMVVARFPHLFVHGTHRIDRASPEIQLDHQLSKASGFYIFDGEEYIARPEPVPLTIMCHPCNLKLMSARSNSIKSSGNHVTLKDLKKRIAEFEKQHGDIFEGYYERYTAQEIVAAYNARKCK